jgi:hypothetical protein
LLAGIITGQEDAVAHFAASAMAMAGSAMIGHGIDALSGGVAMLSLGNPAGAVPVAVGSGLVAGGLALGGVGTGIEHVLAGGVIGQALTGSDASAGAASDPGVNRGRSSRGSGGSRGGGGVTHIHVNYAAAGPHPEDTGRAVNEAWNAYQRSAGKEVRVQGPRR